MGCYFFLIIVYGVGPKFAGATESLESYTIDTGAITVSGVSSGGYMAQQFHVAHSAMVSGAAIFAGGPYHCAGQNYPFNLWRALTRCMSLFYFAGPPDVNASIAATRVAADKNAIDDPRGLRTDKVYLFSGTLDDKVPQPIMDTLYAYYRWFTVAQNIKYVNDVPAAHAMVTDDFGNNSCQVLKAPYINNCDYDAAGALLRQLYGTLNPPVTWDSKSLRSFDQSEFVDDPEAYSLNRVGHLYAPKSCTEGATCRLHVAFHGCLQYQEIIGNAFFARAGYNEWAESNNIIVLYPQTTAKTYWGLPWPNPAGCWDWWGYTSGNYDLRGGVQIQAVKAMIDRLMGLSRISTEGSSE